MTTPNITPYTPSDQEMSLLNKFPDFIFFLRERDVVNNNLQDSRLLKYDSVAYVASRLNKIVRVAKERLEIDNGIRITDELTGKITFAPTDRETKKPGIGKRITELNFQLEKCKNLLERFFYDDVITGWELNKALSAELCGINSGVDNSAGDEKESAGQWDFTAYQMAVSQLEHLQKATETAQKNIKKNMPILWGKTALGNMALSICRLLVDLGEKPTGYKDGLAVSLLAACYESAGGILGQSAYKNAIQAALTQIKKNK
jgi:hypothetical protein